MQKTVKKAQKGFTLIELLIVIAVIAILAAIAIPNLLSSRKAANESSAISSVRTLISAQETYRSRKGTYSEDLATLGTEKLIDSVLASGSKSGYTIAIDADKTDANTYKITAKPTSENTGTRSFEADQTGVIQAADSIDGSGSFAPIQ